MRTVAFLILLAGALPLPAEAVPPASLEPSAVREFTRRVHEYMKLQKAVPRLRTTKHRKEIVERRRALVLKIREARANATPGDIFTREISREFQRVIRSTFRGPSASNVRKTIRQGSPVPGWHLSVNATYPEQLPLTTVPPTLLLQLPQLPAGVAYRIIGHDFVLEDTEARLIVDFIPGVLP
ncbi:MAG: hypothetical protein NTY38_32920 [Acidobacteria bacterium]|nr:hypothetical protein [Acidobacteriota bacterium]